MEKTKEELREEKKQAANAKKEEEIPFIIRKAKITNEDTLVVEYSRNGDAVTIKRKSLIHPDLKDAFEELVPHFALLCDLKEVKNITGLFQDVNIVNKERLRVTCISLDKSAEDSTGVILTGIKQIGTGARQITLNSPFTSFAGENEEYPFSGLLSKAVDAVKDEVILYLKGKHAEPAQKVLELGETSEDEI